MRNDFFVRAIEVVLDTFEFTFSIPISIRPTWKGEEVAKRLSDNGGACCEFRGTRTPEGIPTVNEFVVYIHEDIQSVSEANEFETGIRYRIEQFFESISVDFTRESLFVFSLLHELGHLDVYEKFKRAGTPNEYQKILDTMFGDEKTNQKWLETNKVKYFQYLNAIEARSDIFALSHFVKVWKILWPESEPNVGGE